MRESFKSFCSEKTVRRFLGEEAVSTRRVSFLLDFLG